MEVPDHLLRALDDATTAWGSTLPGELSERHAMEQVIKACDALPRPPKLDVVEECARAAQNAAVRRIGGYIIPSWDNAKEEERAMARDMAVCAIREWVRLGGPVP